MISKQSSWTFDQMLDHTGRIALVTGANSGIGYETALALVRKNAHVILACRSEVRGQKALEGILAKHPGGKAELMLLDLGSLDRVRSFTSDFNARYDRLDLLINNAGVMIPPFSKTEDGYELQIGVNYFGHFALTGLLFEALAQTSGSRIVTVSSLVHHRGRIDFDNFRGEKPYKPWRAYAQSKLANVLFMLELQRRLERSGHGVMSVGAHPGSTRTELQRHNSLISHAVYLWSNSPVQGALPTLYAATSPEAAPGGYYGPDEFFETRGYPAPARIAAHAQDKQTAGRLWELAETETGVHFLSQQEQHVSQSDSTTSVVG